MVRIPRLLLAIVIGWACFTGLSNGFQVPKAGFKTSVDGRLALHLKQGAFPVLMELSGGKKLSTVRQFEAINGDILPIGQDRLAFHARYSRVSLMPRDNLLLCIASHDDFDCRLSPFDEKSPLEPGLMPDQVLGVIAKNDKWVLKSYDIGDNRTLIRSIPLPLQSFTSGYGKTAGLYHLPGREDALLYLGNWEEKNPSEIICPNCQFVLGMGRYTPYALVGWREGQVATTQGGPPEIPKVGLPVFYFRVLSLRDGGFGPVISTSLPLAPPQPPMPMSLSLRDYEGHEVFPLDREGTAFRWCHWGLACRDLLLSGPYLSVVGGPVMMSRVAAPLSGGQWLNLPLPQDRQPVLEWTDVLGEVQFSAPLPGENALNETDQSFCQSGACAAWNLSEVPLAWSLPGGVADFPVEGKSALVQVLGGGRLSFQEKGMEKVQFSGPGPVVNPLWLKEGLLILSSHDLRLYQHGSGKLIWKVKNPEPISTAQIWMAGKELFLVRGEKIWIKTISKSAFRPGPKLQQGGVWLGLGGTGIWAMEKKGPSFFDKKSGKLKKSFVLRNPLACGTLVEGDSLFVLCPDRFRLLTARGGNQEVSLGDKKHLAVPQLWQSPGRVWAFVTFESPEGLAQEFWMVDKSNLIVRKRFPLPAVVPSLPTRGAGWLAGMPDCFLIPDLNWCLQEDGEKLDIFLDTYQKSAASLISKLGLGGGQSQALLSTSQQGIWERRFSLVGGRPWAWRASLSLMPQKKNRGSEWKAF